MHARTNLSALALKHSTLTLFFMLVLVAAGVFAYFDLGRAEDPPFTIKQMVVSATWPGATSRAMELQVTDKLETKLQELPYFYNVQSYTKPGETVIYAPLRATSARQGARPLVPVQEDQRHPREPSAAVLARTSATRYGDTYSLIWAFRVRRLLRRRDEGDREGGAPAPAARARRHQGRPVRRAGPGKIFIEFSHARLAMLGVPSTDLDVVQAECAVFPPAR